MYYKDILYVTTFERKTIKEHSIMMIIKCKYFLIRLMRYLWLCKLMYKQKIFLLHTFTQSLAYTKHQEYIYKRNTCCVFYITYAFYVYQVKLNNNDNNNNQVKVVSFIKWLQVLLTNKKEEQSMHDIYLFLQLYNLHKCKVSVMVGMLLNRIKNF